jgi:protocatechuate 3,4-dioxygenase, beta subunit
VAAGGPCEGCEAIFESPVPFALLTDTVKLADWTDQSARRLIVSGVVYAKNGRPAAGVILYIYHTDSTGIYPREGKEKGWAKRHGYLRGWLRTNEKGEYRFYTLRPGSYPDGTNPAHIHITLKEPGVKAYWIDDYVFDDDPLLNAAGRAGRGGSGILKVKGAVNPVEFRRDIYLGMNIPDYP